MYSNRDEVKKRWKIPSSDDGRDSHGPLSSENGFRVTDESSFDHVTLSKL